ncbi:DUF937 domain-containing protein [Komarekiella sp. 'clone 1']|uniref:DUF937 domain-containing protein n=1 Tax=Komarekiella delphini-convector SJRDD-AB1 TaxID=2593771 RepID=A0AA40T4A1_9NOST|nr:DUF937 domain-containing protein [Komarekiella delphini-convector]MBD6620395.1 DUF937 domain-containing protein [Komarekiella delphini-convector SJRDD-AB1]
MGLFFDVLSAINNPNQQGSVTQLESITNSIQQLIVSRGIQPSQVQNVMSVLGNALRPVLKQQQSALGSNQFQNLIGQVAGSGMGASSLQLLTPQLQQQIVQTVSQRTGLSPNVIQAALPALTSGVLALLNMGSTKPGTLGSNPLLNSFLDSDRDGNTDMGDVLKFANRFLNPHAT